MCGQCICVVGTFLTACNQPAAPRPSEPDKSKAAATVPSPVVQEVKERSYSTVESIPYDSGDIKIISVERKEEKVLFATPEVLSIDLTIASFTGYLNSDWFSTPFNYDLKAGRPLGLADIFKRRSKFLKVLATYCVEEFMKRGLNCGGDGVAAEQWMREGTQPTKDNYTSWNLTRNGILITFGEYQVRPGCLGLVKVVVPYSQLQQFCDKIQAICASH